jgi:hypothetical protein
MRTTLRRQGCDLDPAPAFEPVSKQDPLPNIPLYLDSWHELPFCAGGLARWHNSPLLKVIAGCGLLGPQPAKPVTRSGLCGWPMTKVTVLRECRYSRFVGSGWPFWVTSRWRATGTLSLRNPVGRQMPGTTMRQSQPTTLASSGDSPTDGIVRLVACARIHRARSNPARIPSSDGSKTLRRERFNEDPGRMMLGAS